MLFIKAVTIALIASALSCASALYYKDVTADNFDELIDPSKASILLEFYAPWCGHCKNLAPEYEQLGQAFERTKDVIIAQVDADTHKDLGTRFGVTGFPTLKWIPKGSKIDDAEDCNAGRTADELLSFVNGKTGLKKKLKAAGPTNVITLTDTNFDEVALSENNYALVGFFAPWCTHCKQLKPSWEKLANFYADEHDVIVGAIDCDAYGDLATKYEVKGFPTIKFFGPDGAEVENYEGDRKLEDLVAFINQKTGLDISADGGVTPEAGIIREIAEHIPSYVSASTDEERAEVMSTCSEKIETLDEKAKKNFEYYVKVFGKIAEKGIDYVAKERERLSKMLEAPERLKSSQKKNFMRRVNVLNVFKDL